MAHCKMKAISNQPDKRLRKRLSLSPSLTRGKQHKLRELINRRDASFNKVAIGKISKR